MLPTIHWLPVIGSAVAVFAIGALWYSPVLFGKAYLFLVGGHIALGSAVNEQYLLNTGSALCGSSGIHRCVSAADDGDSTANIHFSVLTFEGFEETDCVTRRRIPKFQDALFGRAYSQNDVVEILFEFFDGGNFLSGHGFHAHREDELNVVFNGAVVYPEAGDDVSHDAAELIALFEQRDLHAALREEIGRGKPRGTPAHYGSFAFFGDGGLCLILHHSGEAALCGRELDAPDIDGSFVEVSHAFRHAVVRADCAGDERQGIFFGYDLQRFKHFALGCELHVGRGVLLNGAALLARSREAVDERHRLTNLS